MKAETAGEGMTTNLRGRPAAVAKRIVLRRDEKYLRMDRGDLTHTRMIDSRDQSIWPMRDTGYRHHEP